jgi:hypothetical protein
MCSSQRVAGVHGAKGVLAGLSTYGHHALSFVIFAEAVEGPES